MAKFINTQQTEILNHFAGVSQQRIAKTYYAQANIRNANAVNFYNINTGASTLDEASKLSYSSHGNESPLLYDYIEDLLIYGMSELAVDFQNGDFGLESSDIEGEAFIPPNIFVPIPGSFFVVQGIEGIFKIDNVTTDTVESGANFYKFHYKFDRDDSNLVEKQVINRYKFLLDKVGTDMNPLILQEDYDTAEILQAALIELTRFYISLFYSSRVDTFILNMNEKLFYDPFLIEFIKKNDLLAYNEDTYILVQQHIGLPSTFSLDYNDTIFRKVEKCDLDKNPIINSVARDIRDKLSILNMRNEMYFQIKYLSSRMIERSPRDYIINNISPGLINSIKTNTLIKDSYKNIIIKYFNNSEITKDDVYMLEKIDYKHNIELFYNLVIVIFILKNTLENINK